MATEARFEGSTELDSWSLADSLAAIIESNARAVTAVQAALPALVKAAEGVAQKVTQGGRIIYLGAGTSGRLALQDAAELPPTFGFNRTVVLMAGGQGASSTAKENAEDDKDEAIQAVSTAEVGSKDAVIGLAASGKTPYTVAGIQAARQAGAFTVGIANNPHTPLLHEAEVAILLDTGPEVLTGSTRLAAGTAQKIVLNALSTAVLVRLGGAYENLMVGMKPSNAKLRQRAISIVAEATGLDPSAASEALGRSQWNMREAIVMTLAGVSQARAQDLLEQHGQRVRDAITAAKD